MFVFSGRQRHAVLLPNSLAGQRVDTPYLAPMSKDYPVPPVPEKASGALFEIAAKKLGLTVVPGPLALISRAYMGRSACVNFRPVRMATFMGR